MPILHVQTNNQMMEFFTERMQQQKTLIQSQEEVLQEVKMEVKRLKMER